MRVTPATSHVNGTAKTSSNAGSVNTTQLTGLSPGVCGCVQVGPAPRGQAAAGRGLHLHPAVELQEFGLQQLRDRPLNQVPAVGGLQLHPERRDETRAGVRDVKANLPLSTSRFKIRQTLRACHLVLLTGYPPA